MPCRNQILKHVEDLVVEKTQQGLSMSLPNANILALRTNLEFQHNVVNFFNSNGTVVRKVAIPSQLVDKYYDQQLRVETVEEGETPLSEFETDLQNLNLTPDVVSYLYTDSRYKSTGKNIEAYTRELQKLINNLQTSFSKDEIMEKIKCL